MSISAAQVKELREKTGLGMMTCKQALMDANGNMEAAIEQLRKQGQATAAKRAGKVAKEGKVTIVKEPSCGIAFELNSETDFVARNEDFLAFIEQLSKLFLEKRPASIAEAQDLTAPEFGNLTVQARLTELIGKIGENLTFRRYGKIDADIEKERLYSYVHGNGKIGVLVKLSSDNVSVLDSDALAELGKNIAMQITAENPLAVDRDRVPSDMVAKEKEIYYTQAQTSGKPEKIWEKIVEGKLTKFFQEMTLLEQAYVRDPDKSVAGYISEMEKETNSKITVIDFIRFELGAEE
jgi:elongation factor Ts